jgi:NAD(P)H-dependent FMN reductase
MIQLVGISGSLRKGSFNTALLRCAQAALPADAQLDIKTLHGIPLYDGDVEARGEIPASVVALKSVISAADGLLLATPEYNAGIPGVFKNAIDWLSRPASDVPRVFGAKPVALIGASGGPFGTVLSQTAWLPILKVLRTNLWTGGRIMVPQANLAFDAGGSLKDAAIQEQLGEFLRGFVAYVARAKRPG